MNVPSRRRHPGPSRLLKVSAAAGIAAVGTTALGFTVAGEDNDTVRTVTSQLPVRPVAWEAGTQSSAQKSSIDAQSSRAEDQALEQARAEAREQAEEQQRAEAAEERRRAEAAERREEARREAEREKAEQQAEQQQAREEREQEKREQEKRRDRQAASRSAPRDDSADPAKEEAPSGSPQQIARQIIGNEAQFRCFARIVKRESGWDPQASNPSSGAYGLVQALPGNKMASTGSDWKTNPATQIKWGLDYMKDRYGSPCGAWEFWQANNWY